MLASFLRLVCKVLFRVKVKGLEHVPDQGPLLMIANHESFLDGLLLGLFIPKRATFVVHSDVLKNWFFRLFLRLTPHVAVNPASPMAIKKVVKRLKAGENVVIFPEGRITITGALMKVYGGPGFIAAKTNVPILPVRIRGAAQSYFGRVSSMYPRTWFPRVSLTVCPSTQIDVDANFSNKQRRELAGQQMSKIMQHLIFSTHEKKTFFEALLTAKTEYGANTKIIEDVNGEEETYKVLLKKTLALGRIACKVSQQDEVVGVMMPNVTNTLALVIGMTAFKRIPGMINYSAGAMGIKNACVAANIKTIITSRQFIEKAKLQDVVEKLDGLQIVYLEDLRTQFGLKDKIWLLAYAVHFPSKVALPSQSSDTAVVLFTSGSEGKPKGVVHSHESIIANIEQVMAVIDFNHTDRFMMVLPVFHAFGFTGSLLPIFRGMRLLMFPSPLQYKVIPEVIYDKGCTVLYGTNTFLAHYAKYAHPYDFYKLRYVIAGAERLSHEVGKIYHEKFGIRILEGYGATECAPVVTANTPTYNRNHSTGQFLPSIAYKLTPVDGINEGGLLHVKGANVMQGYYLYDNPAQLVPPADGWYDTGDIVEVCDEGYMYIKGRAKRFAKVAGEMVSLEVVESIAHTAAPDFMHAASTVEDNTRGENIILFTTDPALKREDLKVVTKNKGIPEIAVVRKVVQVEEIPLLGTGKTDYVTLKEMARAT